MRKTLSLIAAFAFLVSPALADDDVKTSPLGTVSVSAKGTDVRSVLHDLFTQGKKNYVLDLDLRKSLYLNLTDVGFDEAFATILHLSGLDYDLQNGIYFLKKAVEKKATVDPAASNPEPPKAIEAPKKSGRLPDAVLAKTVTTRLQKADLREVLKTLSDQTGVPIELDISVPLYKIDAFLIKTSLKYALDNICRAANLEYAFTTELSLRVASKDRPAVAEAPVKVYKEG
ncbi:MAG: STN domain-containing protein [Fimbriimonadaceae bacterium]|nr:STN domain-containing protein [Fimbriimonadaceae bacterium]